ncbi:GNAT family N-acetyltransferase [Pantanalinema rosaneae CENA516]|uniref:GNAT family N-acetyltransferase n=1 Tax=Pantanalinema rosaneae TaxID=1620701 RepID=UPI003D6DBD32
MNGNATKQAKSIGTTVRLIRTINDLEQLPKVWEVFGATVNSPIEDLTWIKACAQSFQAAGDLQVFVVQQEERSIALAPLMRSKGLFPHLIMLGVKKIYEPMDFLYTDDAVVEVLVNELSKLRSPLFLERIPANSPVIPAIQKIYQGKGWVNVTPVAPYPYLMLDASWTEPETQFNSGRRSDFRRAQRNAEKLGEVRYEILSPTEAEIEPLLQEAYQTELKSWKGANGSALAVNQAQGNFFHQYGRIASQRGILRLCFLRINGEAVAMQIAVEYANRFWLLKVGYNENFARCSPGNLLMLHTVKYAATQGLASYEFLGCAEPWIQLWTQSLRQCVAVAAYPASVSAVMTLIFDQLWQRIKNINSLSILKTRLKQVLRRQ